MAIRIFSHETDEVINSEFIIGSTDYNFAIKNFIPLIDRLEIQRKGQNPKFYTRLEEDILMGCIMPPITIAFVGLKIKKLNLKSMQTVINAKIRSAFILDGLQRMRTLQRAAKRKDISLDGARPLFVNILICDSMDKLLYRMITLNNGQKPMTARHQIEIVASNVYDFSSFGTGIQTEKANSKKPIPGSFKQADFIKAYLSFLSKSINIDNARIIEDKMDELIADKILDTNIKEQSLEFSDIIDLIFKFTKKNQYLNRWFRNANNVIGFCSAISDSYEFVKKTSVAEFEKSIKMYEAAFEYFDVSKIRVGDIRRKSLNLFIKKYEELSKLSSIDLIDIFSQQG